MTFAWVLKIEDHGTITKLLSQIIFGEHSNQRKKFSSFTSNEALSIF